MYPCNYPNCKEKFENHTFLMNHILRDHGNGRLVALVVIIALTLALLVSPVKADSIVGWRATDDAVPGLLATCGEQRQRESCGVLVPIVSRMTMTTGAILFICWLVLCLGFLLGWIMRGLFRIPSDRD